MKNSARLRHLVFSLSATALLMLSSLTHAQWAWKDEAGRRIFSDQAPPANIADKDIFKRPAGSKPASTKEASPSAASNAESTPASSSTTATVTKPTPAASGAGKDSELEKRKKEQAAKEAAKKKEDEGKQAAARKDNCERARSSKAGLDSGMRIARTNAGGEREFLSDEARAAETKRLEGIIASDCK